MQNASGFLGTGASLLVDFTLIIQVLFFIVLCAGVTVQLMANRGRPNLYKWHDRLQAPVVLLNLLFIIFVMVPTFVAVAGSGGSWIPLTHGILGLLAEGVAIYCLLAGFKIIPRKIGTLRYFMWTAFVLWTITLLFGIGVYISFYIGGSASADAVAEHDADMITEPEEPVEEHAEETIVEEAVEEHAEAPVVTETEEAAEAVAEHAEEEVAAPTEEPESAPERAGIVRFSDGAVHSDQVALQLAGIAPPPDGFVYEAWLQGEGQPPLSLGVVEVANGELNAEFTDPQGRSLLNLYNGAFISVEPADDSDPNPSGAVVYSGQVAPAAVAHVRHVVSAIPVTPDGDGFALNALAEAEVLLLQIDAQQTAVSDNSLADLHIHAETALNVIEGQNSPNYGDRDGDGEPFNPGDGFGLLRFADDGYLQSAADHANLAADSDDASDEVKLHAEHVTIAAANAIERAEQIVALEEQILALDNPADAAELVAQVTKLADALLEGVDANSDGQIAPVAGEGGIRTMYQHGQLMGSIELFAVEDVELPAAPAAEETTEAVSEHAEEEIVEPEAPTATPEPAPTDTPAPEATDTPPPPTPTPTVELVSEHEGG